MHTTIVQCPINGEIRVFHHSDWSGYAIVEWGQRPHRVELPASVLQQVGRIATLREVIGVLECMDCAPIATERPRREAMVMDGPEREFDLTTVSLHERQGGETSDET